MLYKPFCVLYFFFQEKETDAHHDSGRLGDAKRTIATIKSMQADIDENMNGYSFFALDERAKKLQSDWHKIEAKNLKITGTENGVEFNMEDFSNENR